MGTATEYWCKRPAMIRPFRWIARRKRLFMLLFFGCIIAYLIVAITVEHIPSPTDQYHTLSDSRKIAYQKAFSGSNSTTNGSVSAPPVVLIHRSTGPTARSWTKLVRKIPEDFPFATFIYWIVLATGIRRRSVSYHWKITPRQLFSFFETLPEPPIIVGHSHGGPVALKIAASYPDSICGLVLVAGACDPYMNDSQGFRRTVDFFTPVLPSPWATSNAELLALTR